jgi:hypothetical protein
MASDGRWGRKSIKGWISSRLWNGLCCEEYVQFLSLAFRSAKLLDLITSPTILFWFLSKGFKSQRYCRRHHHRNSLSIDLFSLFLSRDR